MHVLAFFFFKQKTAYEMRISDWSSDVCSSDLLRQRVLRDVSNVSLETTWFGKKLSLPVGLAPVGLTGMYARRGEVQAARAARARNVPFCLSTVSVCDIAEVVRGAGPIWRSEEHTSELQSLMRISYAVFCL